MMSESVREGVLLMSLGLFGAPPRRARPVPGARSAGSGRETQGRETADQARAGPRG